MPHSCPRIHNQPEAGSACTIAKVHFFNIKKIVLIEQSDFVKDAHPNEHDCAWHIFNLPNLVVLPLIDLAMSERQVRSPQKVYRTSQ
jgi:hypothetical protein